MAKSRSFFGLRRGSTKSLTFQVNKGQQITKDRVYEVANPRTTQQMAQRLRFACAVQFFKHANQALFKYAFESKRPLESDYNTFIRFNALNAGVVSRYMLERNYPAIGKFVVTQGSLGTIEVKEGYTDESRTETMMYLPTVSLGTYEQITEMTIGDMWKVFLEAYPQFEDGDFITILKISDPNVVPVASADEAISKFALCYAKEGVVGTPKWEVYQYKINTADTTPSADGRDLVPWEIDETTDDGNAVLQMLNHIYKEESFYACAVIGSRPISSSEVKVSNSMLVCSSAVNLALDVAKSTPWIEWCASTYEDSQLLLEADAILKGEIVESSENFNAVIADPTAKADGRKVATINRAENIAPSALRVIVDISGSQKRIPLEENWFTGTDVVNYNSKFAGLVNENALYSAYLGSGVEIFVPMSEGLIANGSVVAAASASTAFKLVSLSN